jgi:uncharacterized protein YeaO (DUF488 family)
MAVRIVRLGTPRAKGEGVRLGTVRRAPRGVKKADHGRLDYYDAWLPELAPSAELVKWLFAQEEITPAVWDRFEKGYRRQMKAPERERLLGALALLSHDGAFSVGCYCEDYAHCHRSILEQLLREHGARIASND